MDFKKYKNKILIGIVALGAAITSILGATEITVASVVDGFQIGYDVATDPDKASEFCRKLAEDEPAPIPVETVPVVPLEAPAPSTL